MQPVPLNLLPRNVGSASTFDNTVETAAYSPRYPQATTLQSVSISLNPRFTPQGQGSQHYQTGLATSTLTSSGEVGQSNRPCSHIFLHPQPSSEEATGDSFWLNHMSAEISDCYPRPASLHRCYHQRYKQEQLQMQHLKASSMTRREGEHKKPSNQPYIHYNFSTFHNSGKL